jgi:hypothetical protein
MINYWKSYENIKSKKKGLIIGNSAQQCEAQVLKC